MSRFIEIKDTPIRRHTAQENMMKKRMLRASAATTKLLEEEQWRIIQTWYSTPGGH